MHIKVVGPQPWIQQIDPLWMSEWMNEPRVIHIYVEVCQPRTFQIRKHCDTIWRFKIQLPALLLLVIKFQTFSSQDFFFWKIQDYTVAVYCYYTSHQVSVSKKLFLKIQDCTVAVYCCYTCHQVSYFQYSTEKNEDTGLQCCCLEHSRIQTGNMGTGQGLYTVLQKVASSLI